ncbi:MAG: DNA polymerase IV [Kiritimatiellia bacterium]
MHTIFHIDMDAFFAAVEVLDHPQWAGKPLVVGSPPDRRGVVSTASYEARKFGIHSAMPSRTAHRLCPHAIFAPVRMARYLDVSEQVMRVLGSFTPEMEQLSVDEAFLDTAGVMHRWKSPEALGRAIKDAMRKKTGLTASVGIATNKFLAKLASDLEKPDGLTILPEGEQEILAFLAPLPVSKIWGVGKVTEKLLHQAGFRTIGDVQGVSLSTLVPVVGGALAEHIHLLARGLDERKVSTERDTKSISAENTFDEDVRDNALLRMQLIELVEQVGRRLRASGYHASTIQIKIRFDDFQTITRRQTLPRPVCSDRRLLDSATTLFQQQKIAQPVRLIGFGVSGLSEEGGAEPQLQLFEDPEARREERDARLDRVMDTIRERMGEQAVRRGSRLG